MEESRGEPLTVLISAVGGQGGQLFAQWLFEAGRQAGYYPVGVGLPGLSQREGATVYYIEFFKDPVSTCFFSPFPEKGNTHLVIGLEFLELVRTIREGYLAPDGFVFGSRHRVLTTEEKMPLKGGHLTDQAAQALVKRLGDRALLLNPLEAAERNGLSERFANAVLFGALAASSFLPFPVDAFRKAIERYGVAVRQNLAAFEIGLHFQERTHETPTTRSYLEIEWQSLPHPQLPESLQSRLNDLARVSDLLSSRLSEAARLLVHYQDLAYLVRYLDEIESLLKLEQNRWGQTSVTEEVARLLAIRMTYEDAVRVAQLKTDRARFARIRQQHSLDPSAVYHIADFLSPDPDELTGLLPFPMFSHRPLDGDSLTNFEVQERAYPDQAEELSRRSLQLRVPTTSLIGFLLLRVLLLLKPLRPWSVRFRKEWLLIQAWLGRVKEALKDHHAIALLMAKSGEMVRGYGRTRRKTMAAWRLFVAFMAELARRGVSVADQVTYGNRFLEIVSSGPEGPALARQFATEVLAVLVSDRDRAAAGQGTQRSGEGEGLP
ncbi:MAG: 2-oxoacid:acceptor oxidoreductase family protein [Armatimonadetes bacterium]|nr:2-oxoacid:acceptor oxidoreductase family protein [Armatimonadota bacterium]MDW8120948.1 2-oxoacid:acceptor oxidoreductase family protein [Armatimonadota bacterium]